MTVSISTIGRGISGARWLLAACDEVVLTHLAHQTNENEILLRCLLNRGFVDAVEIRRFLQPQFISHLHDPRLLRDMTSTVERLREAIRQRERILIVTDFDVDGATSSVILSHTLRLIGGGDLIKSYIPDRLTEGYGLSRHIVEQAATEGFRIIITADIGIKSHQEAQLARQLGIDLIICDHHLPDGEDVPADAFAVLCPKGSSGTDYPNKHLAACGVALKLADALLIGDTRRERILSSLAKLTAIGSIADLVDLSAIENRAIVAHGLRALSEKSPNYGLQALLEIAQVGKAITTYDIGFKIGPRINAAGRISHADMVLKLFDAPTRDEARSLALQLDKLNFERQQIQQTLVARLFEMTEANAERLDRVLVFAGYEAEGFHRGVIGIACSKIVERYGRPTLICAIDENGIAHGSARSITGFHLVEALDSVSELLVKYGGHPMAAGFAIKAERIEDFRYRLNRYAVELLHEDNLGRTIKVDAELRIEQLTLTLIRSLERLGPHGIGNPTPQFLLRRVPLRAVQLLKEKHLKLLIGQTRTEIEALWWQAREHYDQLADARTVSLVCQPEINNWNGRERCQLKIIDAALEEDKA